jgi:hypothetical protein
VEAARFLAAGIWRPGRLLRAATSVLADEACTIAAPRKPRGNLGPKTAHPHWSGCRLVSDRVALRGDARGPSSFRPRLPGALTGASSALRCRRARIVRSGGRQGVSSVCDGDWSHPGRPPRVKLIAVGDAHEVAVPRGLKVQAPEPDFEPGWEGVRAAHGIPLAPVLSANHHRDGWRELIFSARTPTWRANCRCGK